MHRVVGKASRSVYAASVCFHYDVGVVDIKNMNVETSRGPFSESARPPRAAKGVIFVWASGRSRRRVARFHHRRWIDIHMHGLVLGTPLLVGGNAPSAYRDKSWEMQPPKNVQRRSR